MGTNKLWRDFFNQK